MTENGGTLSLGAWTQRVFVTLLLGALFLGVWALRDILMMTFLAIILAIVLHLPVQYLQKLGLHRGVSILLALTGVLVLIAVLLVLIVPVLVVQVQALLDDLPGLISDAQAAYDEQAARREWLPDVDWEHITEGDVSDFLIEQGSKLSRSVFPFLSGVGGAITSAVFVFFITIFFITEPVSYLEALLTLFPRGYRPRALEILEQLASMLQRWFIGQLISMTMSGILITLVTGLILRLPNAAALGVISGLMEFVPNFGSIIAVIPAVIIALAKDPILVPFTILAYLVTQQVQSNLVMPRIMALFISGRLSRWSSPNPTKKLPLTRCTRTDSRKNLVNLSTPRMRPSEICSTTSQSMNSNSGATARMSSSQTRHLASVSSWE